MKLPYNRVCRSVCDNFLRGQKVSLPCFFWSTCANNVYLGRTSLKSTSVSHADSVRPTTTSTAAAVPNRDLSRPSVASYVDVARPATAAAATTTAHLDMSSVKRYAIMGTVVFPPILTKWYSWLDNK